MESACVFSYCVCVRMCVLFCMCVLMCAFVSILKSHVCLVCVCVHLFQF